MVDQQPPARRWVDGRGELEHHRQIIGRLGLGRFDTGRLVRRRELEHRGIA
jgi:hypothetical protein